MDLIIRNARLSGGPADALMDIGIEGGRIVAIAHQLAAEGETYDAQGRLVCPGLIETHIHLDKSRIIDRCAPQDCSLIRMANLYANVQQVDRPAQLADCFDMLTHSSARLLNLKDYGFAVGNPGDAVVLNAQTPEQAVAEIAQPLACFKNGKRTVTWDLPQLVRPH
jgi:cytosine/adenosine deaminase-related metal-dependent hydrolase